MEILGLKIMTHKEWQMMCHEIMHLRTEVEQHDTFVGWLRDDIKQLQDSLEQANEGNAKLIELLSK